MCELDHDRSDIPYSVGFYIHCVFFFNMHNCFNYTKVKRKEIPKGISFS